MKFKWTLSIYIYMCVVLIFSVCMFRFFYFKLTAEETELASRFVRVVQPQEISPSKKNPAVWQISEKSHIKYSPLIQCKKKCCLR